VVMFVKYLATAVIMCSAIAVEATRLCDTGESRAKMYGAYGPLMGTTACYYDNGGYTWTISGKNWLDGTKCDPASVVCCKINKFDPITGVYDFQIEACNHWSKNIKGKGSQENHHSCSIPPVRTCIITVSADSGWQSAEY
ncbi:hypothetical protein BGZ80_003155, partial [Entomortierella chlamydospora]